MDEKDLLRARLEGRREAIELCHKERTDKLISVLRQLEQLMQTQPGSHAEGVDRGRAVMVAYKNSMRVVSQTNLGVEPEEVLDHEPPPPSEQTKKAIGTSLRELVGTKHYGNPAWLRVMPDITAMEQRRAFLKQQGVSKAAVDALLEAAKQLGICTLNSPMRWFFNLTSHVMREVVWITRGIDIPEELTDNEGPDGQH